MRAAIPVVEADWPGLAGPRRVRAVTTRRDGPGLSQPPFDAFNLGHRGPDADRPEAVETNRARLMLALGLPGAPRWLRQVHGTTVLGDPGVNEPEADAAVTADPACVLAILTADCLPVVLVAADQSEVGAAHAGWRGLAAGVLEATVAAMHTPPERLHAWLGPAAGPRRYEVGEEVFVAFTERDPAAAGAFVPTRPGHWHVDLYALARRRLAAAGLPATAVGGGDRCTIGEPDAFYSHRRDGRTGRMATLAWLGGPG